MFTLLKKSFVFQLLHFFQYILLMPILKILLVTLFANSALELQESLKKENRLQLLQTGSDYITINVYK